MPGQLSENSEPPVQRIELSAYTGDRHAKAPVLSRNTGCNFWTQVLLEKLSDGEIGHEFEAAPLDKFRRPPLRDTEEPRLPRGCQSL